MAYKSIIVTAVINLKLVLFVLCIPYFAKVEPIQSRVSFGMFYVFFLLISITSFAYGNDYYVRSDLECIYSGDGTSQDCAFSNGSSGAWKGFSAISWGSDIDQVGSGDILHICGQHNENLNIGGSGQPDFELVITGLCFDKPGLINGGNSYAALRTMDNSYLHISNLEIIGGEKAALSITSSPKYSPVFVRVTNNTIHDPIYSDVPGYGHCVNSSGSDISFSKNEIFNCSEDGMYIKGDRVEVAYSYVHDVDISNVRRGDCVKYSSAAISNDGHVHHNLLDHSSNNIQKNALIIGSPGSGTIVEYNTIIGGRVTLSIRNHSNAIVRYNRIIAAAPETSVWSAGIGLENAFNTNIYRNVIDASDRPTFGLFSFRYSDGTKIDNNVFVGDSANYTIRLIQGASTYLRNNIIDGSIKALGTNGGGRLIESDYNRFIYDSPNSIMYNSIVYNSLSDFQYNHPSLDQNSTTGVPMFVSRVGGNYKLDKNSPLIDAGMLLDLPVDALHTIISHITPTDIGAYEMNENLLSPELSDVYKYLDY